MIHHTTDHDDQGRGCFGAVLLAVTLWAFLATALLVVRGCTAPPSVEPVRESGVTTQ